MGETIVYESDEIPDLSEIGASWDERLPKWHGDDLVAIGRRVARLPGVVWPYEPEDCLAGPQDTKWILDGQVLLCTGCGIDGT